MDHSEGGSSPAQAWWRAEIVLLSEGGSGTVAIMAATDQSKTCVWCWQEIHDDKRNSTPTLFAALNVLDGSVIGRNMQRHRHQDFVRFLNAVEVELPPDKAVHIILDSMRPTSRPRSVPGLIATHAGPSTPSSTCRLP